MPNPLYDALFAPHRGSQRVFLDLGAAGEVTYDHFVTRAAQMADILIGMGVKTGDRIAVHVEKAPEMLMLYAACVQGGIVFLPLNPAYTPAETTYFLQDSDAVLLVTDEGDAWAGLGVAQITLAALAARSLAAAGRFETVDRGPDDIAAILYTSGTTGRSKGAALTQMNLLSNAQALVGLWQFTERDVLLHALPVFHTHGLFVATHVMVLTGGGMLFLPRFDVDTVFEVLPRATSMMGVPTFYTRLLTDPRLNAETTAHMRLFVSGSAPLLPDTHADFHARTGHWILERYGMTETNMITSNPFEGERRTGTVGVPLPDVAVRIADPETGNELPRGEIGRIEVRGPNVFAGYWRNPEKTAQDMRDDGFFITGDLGVMTPDGYVQIVGREKDLIISGGFNIYPKEIETALDALDGVLESAVVGVADGDMGERVVAYIVPHGWIDLDAVKVGLSTQLARFKQPRDYIVVDALPRNAMGKVQKNLLKQRPE